MTDDAAPDIPGAELPVQGPVRHHCFDCVRKGCRGWVDESDGTIVILSPTPGRVVVVMSVEDAEALRTFLHAGIEEEVNAAGSEAASLTSSAVRRALQSGVGDLDYERTHH